MRSPLRTAGLSLLASLLMIATARAETTKEGDWRIECPESPDSSSTCQMVHAPAAPDGGAPHFLMSVSTGTSGALYGVVTTPLSVYLVPGIELAVDGGRPFKANFELCDTAGCHAGFRLSGPVLAAFQKGQSARLRIWVSKSRAIEVPVSLKGFSKGVQRLKQDGQR